MKSFDPSFFLSSNTAIEFVRITVLVVAAGPSEERCFGVAGAGLVRSCANIRLVEKMQIAPTSAYKQTLMLTPNLPLLRSLETVRAVDRNAVLIVVAQKQIGVFACALIAHSQSDVGRQLIAESNCAADSTEMFGGAEWNWTEKSGETAGLFCVFKKELRREERV